MISINPSNPIDLNNRTISKIDIDNSGNIYVLSDKKIITYDRNFKMISHKDTNYEPEICALFKIINNKLTVIHQYMTNIIEYDVNLNETLRIKKRIFQYISAITIFNNHIYLGNYKLHYINNYELIMININNSHSEIMEMEPINGLLCVITKFDYVFINKNNEVISRTVNEQLTFEYRVIDYPGLSSRYVAERFLTNDMYLHMDGKKYKIDKNTSKYTQILCGDVFMLSCKFNNRLLISSFSGVHFF